MACSKMTCRTFQSMSKLPLRSPSCTVLAWSASRSSNTFQRRIVGSHSLPSAQSRSVVRIALKNRGNSSSETTSHAKLVQQQNPAKCLHSSAHQEQSTLSGLEFATTAGHRAATLTTIARPTLGQLRDLFFTSSIPFIGFGFMDNFIMIQAGGLIDATLGVKLGLATMTAAAMGQVISDVSGVVFGGTLERFLQQWNLVKEPTLTAAQRSLSICRNTSMGGAAVGVMLGCFLGACSLMFVDLEVHERQKNAVQLRNIVQDMMSSLHDDAGLDCEACTVFLTEQSRGFASLRSDSQKPSPRRLEAAIEFLNHVDVERAFECAEQRKVMTSVCDQVLYVPVISVDGSDLLAVIEFRNKQSTEGTFTSEDEQTAKIMARHVAIFMQHLSH